MLSSICKHAFIASEIKDVRSIVIAFSNLHSLRLHPLHSIAPHIEFLAVLTKNYLQCNTLLKYLQVYYWLCNCALDVCVVRCLFNRWFYMMSVWCCYCCDEWRCALKWISFHKMSISYVRACGWAHWRGINEVVDDEDDDVGSSGCGLHSPHFTSVAFDAFLISKGVCWSVSTLCSYSFLS